MNISEDLVLFISFSYSTLSSELILNVEDLEARVLHRHRSINVCINVMYELHCFAERMKIWMLFPSETDKLLKKKFVSRHSLHRHDQITLHREVASSIRRNFGLSVLNFNE
jgi:hypothetical protein